MCRPRSQVCVRLDDVGAGDAADFRTGARRGPRRARGAAGANLHRPRWVWSPPLGSSSFGHESAGHGDHVKGLSLRSERKIAALDTQLIHAGPRRCEPRADILDTRLFTQIAGVRIAKKPPRPGSSGLDGRRRARDRRG